MSVTGIGKHLTSASYGAGYAFCGVHFLLVSGRHGLTWVVLALLPYLLFLMGLAWFVSALVV